MKNSHIKIGSESEALRHLNIHSEVFAEAGRNLSEGQGGDHLQKEDINWYYVPGIPR